MKKAKETNDLSSEDIEKLSNDLHKNNIKDVKDMITISAVLTVIVFCLSIFLISFFSKNTTNIKPYSSDDTPAMLLLILMLSFGLMAYLNLYIQSRKGNGRTIIRIKILSDENEINNKIENILKYLYYKEKKYKNGKAYFAFKDRYTLNTRSKNRYISYSINNGELIVEAWIYILGRELPIDKQRIADISKRALAYDLKYISENIDD